jgi:hypothetical protein
MTIRRPGQPIIGDGKKIRRFFFFNSIDKLISKGGDVGFYILFKMILCGEKVSNSILCIVSKYISLQMLKKHRWMLCTINKMVILSELQTNIYELFCRGRTVELDLYSAVLN